MPEKKRQHYVPRLLLRRFAAPNQEAVRLLDINSGKIIPIASIKGQCSEDYFYGKNPTAENTLESIETEFAKVLPRLTTGHAILPVESIERAAVTMFIAAQLARTRIVDDPKDYRFCGYAEAVAGERIVRDRSKK